jgi:hypothetical protein
MVAKVEATMVGAVVMVTSAPAVGAVSCAEG